MPEVASADPIWTLPPYTIHVTLLAEQLGNELPWHVSDFFIDKYVWPKDNGSVKIGVVDTGVSLAHPELDGKIENAEDFTGNQRGPADGNGHGTHVAGIIAAKSFGIASKSKLVIAKGLNDNGSGSDQTLSRGIKYCVDQGCKVLNLSAGSNMRSPAISGILKEAAQQGVIASIAAGNDSADVGWPAAEEFVLAITALTRQRTIAPFSNRGAAADVAAPGAEIRSLGRGGAYVVMSGTSMAAPWVSGYIAAYAGYRLSIGKSFPTFEQIVDWLGKTSTDLGDPGKDFLYGLGLPNAQTGFQDVQPPVTPPVIDPQQPTINPSGQPASIMVTMPSGKQFMYKDGKVI